jgi:NADP-dependent aldehyde dehydrogenase
MALHGKNIIAGSLRGAGTETFQAINPATSTRLEPRFHNATQEELDKALELADRAFQSRGSVEPAQTAALLERIADEIEALGDALIQRCEQETALTAGRLTAERGRTTGQLRLFAQVVTEGSWVDARIDTALPDRKPVPKPDVRRMLIPIGPVLVFPASNFPLAFSVAGGDTASALAAGCPVIVKARPQHAGTSELVGMAIQKAVAATGMPEGWFSMVHGPGRTTGVYLVRHPVIQAVGFTGSATGGRALFDAAASRPSPIPVYAEMGSINPVFLLPGALGQRADKIAEGLHQSMNLGVGQFCTQPGLVIALDDQNLERLLTALGRLVQETAPATMLMGPIAEGYQQGLDALDTITGVKLLARSGQRPDPQKTQAAAALYATDAATFLHNEVLCREVFGPSTLVVRCRTRGEMLDVARSLEGQLTATIHAAEGELIQHGQLVSILQTKAGRLIYGGFPTGVEVCPSMNHGGPYPATTDVHFTSVGTAAILRFARPVCYQNFPESQLPPELCNENVRGIWRMVDGVLTKQDPGHSHDTTD